MRDAYWWNVEITCLIYGLAQSQTRLKRLSSSMSSNLGQVSILPTMKIIKNKKDKDSLGLCSLWETQISVYSCRMLKVWDVQSFSTSTVPPRDQMFLWWEAGMFSSVAGMFSCIPNLCPLDANSSTHPPDLTTKNASRHCQLSTGESKQNCPQKEPPG